MDLFPCRPFFFGGVTMNRKHVAAKLLKLSKDILSEDKLLSKELRSAYGKMSVDFNQTSDKFIHLLRKEVDDKTAKTVLMKMQDIFDDLDEVSNILNNAGYTV
jgi:hypothetical protein